MYQLKMPKVHDVMLPGRVSGVLSATEFPPFSGVKRLYALNEEIPILLCGDKQKYCRESDTPERDTLGGR